jgi:hypothetical protein
MQTPFLEQLKVGIIKGWKTPTLPPHIIDFQNKPIIRILRILGGLSYLILLSKSYFDAQAFIKFIALFFAFIFCLYHLYIYYHRIKHIRYVIKSGQLDIRNSPLQQIASLPGKAVICLKGNCETLQPVGVGKILNSNNSSNNNNNLNIISNLNDNRVALNDFPLNLLPEINQLATAELMFLFIILNIFIVKYITSLDYNKYIPNNKVGNILKFFIIRYIILWSKSVKVLLIVS